MKLNASLLNDLSALRDKGYAVPEYDVAAMKARTLEKPQWVHFGPGNIFRAHIARAHQELLNKGGFDTGIIAFTGKGSQTIAQAYAPFDNLCLSVSLKASGSMDRTLAASVAEAYTLEGEGWKRAQQVFTAPSLMLASFTITEKGYSPASYQADLTARPEEASTLLGQVAYLLKLRLNAGGQPMTLVSMDNCSQNGDKLKDAVTVFGRGWAENGLVPRAFASYLETKVS